MIRKSWPFWISISCQWIRSSGGFRIRWDSGDGNFTFTVFVVTATFLSSANLLAFCSFRWTLRATRIVASVVGIYSPLNEKMKMNGVLWFHDAETKYCNRCTEIVFILSLNATRYIHTAAHARNNTLLTLYGQFEWICRCWTVQFMLCNRTRSRWHTDNTCCFSSLSKSINWNLTINSVRIKRFPSLRVTDRNHLKIVQKKNNAPHYWKHNIERVVRRTAWRCGATR